MEEIIAYQIIISKLEYNRWRDRLIGGESLPPEITGLLLGRATPAYVAPKLEVKWHNGWEKGGEKNGKQGEQGEQGQL